MRKTERVIFFFATKFNQRDYHRFGFDILEKHNSINSTYNGIAFTADLIDDHHNKIRLFALRSFGESLYHSITDSSLEFGFKAI